MYDVIRSNGWHVDDHRMIITSIFNWQFGIIIPEPTGVFFSPQTAGVCCHHPLLEGIFIPLSEPTIYNKNKKEWVSLLKKITELNYSGRNFNRDEYQKAWDAVKKEMGWDWRELTQEEKSEQHLGFEEEGYMWVEITKVPHPHDDRQLGDDYRQLIGEWVLLIYPNCD